MKVDVSKFKEDDQIEYQATPDSELIKGEIFDADDYSIDINFGNWGMNLHNGDEVHHIKVIK